MGKDSDKMYITHSEWATLDFGAGGFKNKKTGKDCALTLTPFDIPRCTRAGHIFDLLAIVPWIKKHGTNPVTGAPLSASDLIPLHFHKNKDGAYHDPITFKVFTDNTHIVACPSGHVFAWETIDELCVKPKSWRDLMTDEPFKRKDIITLQDPHNVSMQDINSFHYKVHEIARPLEEGEDAAAKKRREIAETINATGTTSRILAAMAPPSSTKKQPAAAAPITPSYVPKKQTSYNTAHFSDNTAAASFTSLGATAVTKNKSAVLSDTEYLVTTVKERASARIETSAGSLDVALFCDVAPRACYNFIQLAREGYYNGVSFHRVIRNFMAQTGDPTGTGRGGKSWFGYPFPDEFKNLSHDEQGILSMANKGPNTNNSQFFITFKQCKHLDGKHTIFGKVTTGIETLDNIESTLVDSSDKPKSPITVQKITILNDPFEKALNVLKGTDPTTLKKVQDAVDRKLRQEANDRIFAPKPATDVIGKYIKKDDDGDVVGEEDKKRSGGSCEDIYENAERRKKKKKSGNGEKMNFDFSSW
ncbi:Peptidyl-prolyl cis-trans isomerase cyp8 [Physocladia obscura]|uniref:Peptidyl-prolyl cis-trans isomerase cyp8 n=1 Tax=Physocladia obscura TaxID=109957 RepID=A0AAD5T4I5_9FUNG|nr:Peptidyl-prolyl cis-trans isomerase cyp8 [Physocladia obscura]